jgi:hypothetical protein
MFTRITKFSAAAAVAVAVSVSGAGVASAATVYHPVSTAKPVMSSGTYVAAVSAFPAGGKGSGSEATCNLWSGRLQQDQGSIDSATEDNDLSKYQQGTEALNEDKDNAMEAGCVVID